MTKRRVKIRKIRAFVIGGRGLASEIRSVEIKTISKKFDISLINGSLNLIAKSPVWLDFQKAVYNNGEGQFYWKAYLNDIPVILNRWSMGTCPAHMYEIFAEEHLRSKFGLADGDSVALTIPVDIVDKKRTSSILNRLVWYLLWWGREPLVYHDGRYRTFVYHWRIHGLTGRAYQNSIL